MGMLSKGTRTKGGAMGFQDYSHRAAARLHLGQVKPHALAGCALICLAVVAALLLGAQQLGEQGSFQVIEAAEEAPAATGEPDAASEAQPSLFVHVTGCVAHPGLYELAPDARTADAIAAAGGFTAEADEGSLNLAQVLSDGEQVRVPSREEAAADAAPPAEGAASAGATAPGKVNINTSDAAQLQSISGIGAAKAQKIISYREANGRFKSIEDIVGVSGIGEKTLASIRDQICV